MKRNFSWDRIGKIMYKTYEWVLGGGQPPEWVITDLFADFADSGRKADGIIV